jgi:hypothetical protein
VYEFNTPSANYTVACSAVSFVVSLFVVIAHFLPVTAVLFVGTIIEGATCVVLLAFWTAVVSLITEASAGLISPEDPTGEVQNANLYYFSWAGFFTIALVTVDYCRAAFGIDAADTLRNHAPRLALWSGLGCAAVVVMGSSARILKNDCTYEFEYDDFRNVYCARTRYGVSIGTLGLASSIGIIYMKVKGISSLSIESALSLFLTILNTCGVAYITAASGPGATIGNMYYFSWVLFLLSVFILFNCYGEYSGHNESATDPTVPSDSTTPEQPQFSNKTGGGDIEVETFEENI